MKIFKYDTKNVDDYGHRLANELLVSTLSQSLFLMSSQDIAYTDKFELCLIFERMETTL